MGRKKVGIFLNGCLFSGREKPLSAPKDGSSRMAFLETETGVWSPAIAVHLDRLERSTGSSEWLAIADSPQGGTSDVQREGKSSRAGSVGGKRGICALITKHGLTGYNRWMQKSPDGNPGFLHLPDGKSGGIWSLKRCSNTFQAWQTPEPVPA